MLFLQGLPPPQQQQPEKITFPSLMFLCDLVVPNLLVYWGENLDHLLQVYHPVAIHIVHPAQRRRTGSHLNAHCSFSSGLPPEVTSIDNRSSLKSMKLLLSLSQVLKSRIKSSGCINEERPEDVIAELLDIAIREACGVDLHEGRLREKSVRTVLLLLLL